MQQAVEQATSEQTPGSAEATALAHRLSVVVPMYNEEDNALLMVARVDEALADYPHPWELIMVDDGSSDATAARLKEAGRHHGAHVRVVELQRNFGQTAAMQAGIDTARGDVIVTLDGDLQNDPVDIPRMVKRLLEEDLDLVAGWRKARRDNLWLRKLPSKLANRLIARITGVYLHDYGCSLKAFRAHVLKSVRLYGEMHRFIPAWIATNTTPARIREEVVTHHARQHGTSKYGIARTFRVLLDLLSVYFFMRYRARPGHFFGKIALVFGGLGSVILGYLFVIKLLGHDIGTRPLLLIGVLCVIMAVQFLTTGVLSEMMSRTYFESSASLSYVVRNADELTPAEQDHWKQP